jgi:PPOX class probable FMN-dependent enzyme
MTDWMHELCLLTEAEFHNRRIVATLATVDGEGNPRARTVFVRAIEEQARILWITTDSRSPKVEQIRSRPVGELVIWTPHERQQFRILGRVEVVPASPLRDEIWSQLSDATRALSFLPAPGSPRQPDQRSTPAVPATAAPPSHFVLLALHPSEAESLELNDTPPRRRRWRQSNGWAVEEINP